ncbi:GNAT family N-acetyltransferase [Roseibium litorale]|uniref:GNAT family N-acetyltransferase n=1 Tax=Roseibium litorale TaxID=2803841 RepID=A0ABR9CJN5_9HYPH|nr:GNAT family N-acetyltransferase [Roseibium litorale]MBD8891053.1 GNAT family N-acetyltransferase [Roseibium litorale]
MSTGIIIKRLEASDVDAFRRIRLEALRAEPANFASTYEDWAALSEDAWMQRLDNPVFAAFLDREPVGLMGLFPESLAKMAHRASIMMVYVRKNLRGTGLARELLAAVTDHARNCGILQLELVVSAENPAAMRFYQREGFVEYGRLPGGYIYDGKEIVDVLMMRRLTDQPVQ